MKKILQQTIIEQAIKQSAERMAGFIPHLIIGEADASDMRHLIVDLRDICRRIVDPLIEAYGEYAAEHAHGIDQSLFKEQLWSALDGNATFTLECAADAIAEEHTEFRYEKKRGHFR